MAIDTKAKRASVQAYTFGLMRPPPDGAVDEGDRATAAWLYAGHDYQAAIPVQLKKRRLMLRNVGRMLG